MAELPPEPPRGAHAPASESARLIEDARQLGCMLTSDAAERLLTLLDELSHWGRAYNLTAIRDREELITHHLLDSLSVHAYLRGERIADVGTGAGFPGLPLAILAPQRTFTLIDASQKKLRFVTHAARLLGLANVTALHERVERLRLSPSCDTVVARAFAPLGELLESIEGLCAPGGRVVAMKGRLHTAELAAVAPPWQLIESPALHIPGLGEARHLVVLERRER
jgi:16S rRNA (guanine527-N7)-methyltransferase